MSVKLAALLIGLILIFLGPSSVFSQETPDAHGATPPSTQRAEIPGATTPRPAPSPADAIKIVLGLAAVLVLAYIGGQPRVQAIERKLRVSQLVIAGLPFVFLGFALRHPAIGVFSDPTLHAIRPVLEIGLGWIGFNLGFRFDGRLFESLPRGTAAAAALATFVPFLAIVAACSILLLATHPSLVDLAFLRDAVLLGTAGAMTARTAPYLLESRGEPAESVARVARIVQLEQLSGVVGLMALGAFFRPQGPAVAWQIPGTAWLFITLGMGTMIALFIFATLRGMRSGPEFTLLILGSVCFTAGMAGYLRLSPVVVCFIAGLILVNVQESWTDEVRDALHHLERPIYLLFLVIAGAMWEVSDWQGWLLMALFVTSRLAGRWLAMLINQRHQVAELSAGERQCLAVTPMGALSVAIVVNAQDLYFGSPTIPWIVTAVIGGSMVTEVAVQVFSRSSKSLPAAAAPEMVP